MLDLEHNKKDTGVTENTSESKNVYMKTGQKSARSNPSLSSDKSVLKNLDQEMSALRVRDQSQRVIHQSAMKEARNVESRNEVH